MLKKDSHAWQPAKKIERQSKGGRKAIALSADGQTVTFISLIRGNTWERSLAELELIARR